VTDSIWIGEFKNDSCSIRIDILFNKNSESKDNMTGQGTITGMISDKSFKEDIFVVMEKLDNKIKNK
jgi:hypothetical protein